MTFKVGVLLGSALVSTLMLSIAPAGAATGTVCKTDTGSFTFSPSLPKEGSPTLVNGAAHWEGTLGGCSNGVSGGSFTGIGNYIESNCTVSLHTNGVTTAKITWRSAAGTSTIRFRATPTGDGAKYAGTVTAGRFKGTHITMPLAWVTLSPPGACGTAGLKTIVFKSTVAVHL